MPSEFRPPNHRSSDRSPDGAQENAARFEPRVVGEPAADGDLPVPDQWPADLEALAEQLAADADFLAGCYPAVASPAPAAEGNVAAPSRRSLRWLRHAAAAVALFVIGGTVAIYRLQSNENDPVTAITVTHVQARDRGEAAVSPVDIPAITPAVGFHELTPPEQEAVLDLLEVDSEPVRLSI